MATARANWKGFLKVGELVCPVSLYTAASTSQRIAFHTVDRDTGHRLSREFYDPSTGKAVAKEDQIKGFEVAKDEYILLEPDEITAALPQSNKTLDVIAFIPCGDVDTIYFDKPYYLAPQRGPGDEAFAVLLETMRQMSVAAVARAVLFRRLRSIMLRAHGSGFLANTLNFDYQVRSSESVFKDVGSIKVGKEMLDLAKHIIETKRGDFDPKGFDDRYEAAVADLVRAKMEGRTIKVKAPPKTVKATNLLEALRASAGVTRPTQASKRSRKRLATARKPTKRKAA